MAIYYRDYYGVTDDNVNIGQQYSIGGVYKFTISSAHNYIVDSLTPLKRVQFSISGGTVLPNTEYYNTAFGITLITGNFDAAALIKVLVNDLNDNGISGIGTFAFGSGSDCYYEYPGTGVITPTKSGYTFKPISYTIPGDTVAAIYDNFNADEAPAPPEKPINPTPEHEGSGIALHDTTATWENGGGATSYNIYYGTLSGFLELVAEGVSDLEQVLIEGNFDHYGEIYYWRVDAVNDAGVTQGDEWAFTTLIYNPVLPTGLSLVDGEPTGTPTGENNMITVRRLVAAAENAIWYEDV